MKTISGKENRSLASLAVFRELYDKKTDVYNVIAEFLKEIIISNAKHTFSLTEISNLLNDIYNFNIPDAVVKTALNRLDFLTKSFGVYNVSNIQSIRNENEIELKTNEFQNKNNLILSELYQFIENKTNKNLSITEKQNISNSFISYLLDESGNNTYDEYISAYIVSNQYNTNFTNQLNIVKEGVILYSGISYTSNLNNLGSWNTEMTIFVDTEILFHFAGFNGVLFQKMFDDFYSFVKEINSKSKKKLIRFKYFKEVRDEFEKFFTKAEYIVTGNQTANPSITAMTNIIEGCKTGSDVVAKKTKFYELLKSNGIKEDDYSDYYNEKNHKYNIENKELIDNLNKLGTIQNVENHLQFLNYVSIHRKEANKENFENVKFILLSGNSNTLSIAWHEDVKQNGQVPLATALYFLTNKLWFKLNKGFSKNYYPTSFSIITKAQIVLSNGLNLSVGQQFEELQTQIKSGKLTEEEAIAVIVNLRKQAKKPEEIVAENISDVLEMISDTNIEKYINEQHLFKDKAQKQAIENVSLKNELVDKEKIIIEKDNELKLKTEERKLNEIEYNKKILSEKNELLTEKKISIEDQIKIKDKAILITNKKHRNFKLLIGSIYLLYFIGWILVVFKYGWDKIEPWTFIVGIILPIVVIPFYNLIFEKKFDFITFIKIKREKIYQNRLQFLGYSQERIEKLNKDCEKLEKEIEKYTQHLL